MLAGPPGVGKSQCLVPMQIAVTAAVLPEDQLEDFKINHNDFMYNRISENVFFDSYNGQFNCNFDDLGQMKDVAGVSNSSYMEAIRMINSCSYDLHMAHLEDKGNINFRSKLIWATTNTVRFRLASITDDRAFCRRFKCAYLVVPNKDYRVDPNEQNLWKVKLDTSKGYIPGFDHLEFYPYDIYNGEIKQKQPYTFKEVVSIIINEYKNNVDFGEKSISFHQAMKEEYIKQRIEPQGGDSRFVVIDGTPSFTTYDVLSDITGVSVKELVPLVKDFKGDTLMGLVTYINDSRATRLCGFEGLHECTRSYLDIVKEKVRERYSSYANIIKDVSVLSSITATAVTLYTVYKNFSQTRPQSSMRNKFVVGPRVRSRQIVRSKVVQNPEPQLASDPMSLDILRKVHKRSMYDIRLPGATRPMGFITFVKGQDAIMPMHFAEKILYT
jgi:hypothetical protein